MYTVLITDNGRTIIRVSEQGFYTQFDVAYVCSTTVFQLNDGSYKLTIFMKNGESIEFSEDEKIIKDLESACFGKFISSSRNAWS